MLSAFGSKVSAEPLHYTFAVHIFSRTQAATSCRIQMFTLVESSGRITGANTPRDITSRDGEKFITEKLIRRSNSAVKSLRSLQRLLLPSEVPSKAPRWRC